MTNRIRSAAAYLFLVSLATLTSSFDLSGRPNPVRQGASLTFADRVAYQYAIEEVYWRHRIWPKENPSPKPSLDEVISPAQVEKKVEDYLRSSQLLADRQQWPIAPNELQAEMDRMAAHTKQPDVLRELFAALGNDPFVIAECLARPILAESSRAKSRDPADIRSNIPYKLPEISIPLDCIDDTWTATSTTNAPMGRTGHTAVWTGSEMIVWGGFVSSGATNTGGRYNPATDSWIATSITNAPAVRDTHTAVWTGSEMIVWGGFGPKGYFDTGGRYNPATNSWTATSTANAPDARQEHTAVWTGSEMIVWGGTGNNPGFLDTGGRYNPSMDIWIATSTTNAPIARRYHTAVWTGSEMILWGGYATGISDTNTGGRYNPSTDSWTPTDVTNAPASREHHKAVWTGSEMIIWGGVPNGGVLNTGGRYNPATNSWTATSTANAPSARTSHTEVWTGSEVIVWGGGSPTISWLNTGGRYDPITDSWRATSLSNVPAARNSHTTVWTGSQMIVWGGSATGSFPNTGGRYCAQPSAPIVQSAASRKTHGSAGSFEVNLPLSGTPGIECRAGSATNDYTMVITFLANVSVNGSPQAAVTLGTGTIGSGGVSNGGIVTISGNVVTIPLTNVANAQTINVTLNNVNGSTNIIIPMSVLVGDTNANATVNAADVAQTKARLGQTVGGTNFRSDVNANGSINAADTAIVKQNSGTSLPP